MSTHKARKFVARMRDDHQFREKALATTGPEELAAFMRAENIECNQRELVGAMAECMAQAELQELGR